MLQEYPDILALTDKEPLWFDSNGVPRYAPFHPNLVPSIYADEAVLYEIACQACGRRFNVAEQWSDSHRILEPGCRSLAEVVRSGTLYYGDPPRHMDHDEGACAGVTMSCDSIRVIEFWHKIAMKWARDPSLEIRFDEGKH